MRSAPLPTCPQPRAALPDPPRQGQTLRAAPRGSPHPPPARFSSRFGVATKRPTAPFCSRIRGRSANDRGGVWPCTLPQSAADAPGPPYSGDGVQRRRIAALPAPRRLSCSGGAAGERPLKPRRALPQPVRTDGAGLGKAGPTLREATPLSALPTPPCLPGAGRGGRGKAPHW